MHNGKWNVSKTKRLWQLRTLSEDHIETHKVSSFSLHWQLRCTKRSGGQRAMNKARSFAQMKTIGNCWQRDSFDSSVELACAVARFARVPPWILACTYAIKIISLWEGAPLVESPMPAMMMQTTLAITRQHKVRWQALSLDSFMDRTSLTVFCLSNDLQNRMK